MTRASAANATALPTDRRSLLGGAALASLIAASAAAPALAAATEHPDADIFEMVRLIAASHERLDDLYEQIEVAFEEYVPPPYPEALFCREDDRSLLVSFDFSRCAQCRNDLKDEWRYFYEDETALSLWAQKYWTQGDAYINGQFSEAARARVREIKSTYERWQADIKAAERAVGASEQQEAADQQTEELNRLLWQLATTPARTIEGVGAKAQAWACHDPRSAQDHDQRIADLLVKGKLSWRDMATLAQLTIIADARRLWEAAREANEGGADA